MGFTSVGEKDTAVFNDFAFVQSPGRDMVVIASGTENKVALVDLSSGSPRVTKMTLSNSGNLSARRNMRQVEWVRDTPYVWIDGTEADNGGEVYVINIDTKQVVKTIRGIKTTKMLNVQNYERKHTMELIQNIIGDSLDKTSSDNNQNGGGNGSGNGNGGGNNSGGFGSNSANANMKNSSESKVDPVGIAALITALVAGLVAVANMIFMNRALSALRSGVASDKFHDDDGKKSLGSSKIPV